MHKHNLLILCYHGVTDENGPGLFNCQNKFLRPEAFERQLAYLKRHYTPIGLDNALAIVAKGKNLPSNPVVVTFDDGYRNFASHALPLLEKHNMPATLFVVTDFLDGTPLWFDRLEYAIGQGLSTESYETCIERHRDARNKLKSLPEEKRMEALAAIEDKAAAKFVDFSDDRAVYEPISWSEVPRIGNYDIVFGSHSLSHPFLSRLTRSQQHEEISRSFQILKSHTPYFSKVFSYPNGQKGDMNNDTHAELKALGFTAALTTISGLLTTLNSRFMLPRIVIGSDDFIYFVSKISNLSSWLKR